MKIIKLFPLFGLVAALANAGPHEDALSAYKRADYKTAMKIWGTLAEQGNASAQYNLGVMYNLGNGVAQDYAEAMKWYLRAAAQGNAEAQFRLGLMHYAGRGVPEDYIQAYLWWDIAASGSTDKTIRASASKGLDAIAKDMTPAQIVQAKKLAREWKPTGTPR